MVVLIGFCQNFWHCLGWSFNEFLSSSFHRWKILPFPLSLFSPQLPQQEPQIPALEILSNIMTDMGYVPLAERNGEREFPWNPMGCF